jgi:hypothetical protein
MNWHDVITIGERQVELVPQAGMLVQYPDDQSAYWGNLRDITRKISIGDETHVVAGGVCADDWAWFNRHDNWEGMVSAGFTPILPAVTPGCGYTRGDVLTWLMPDDYLDLGGGHHAQWQEGIGLTLCVDGSIQRPADIPALKLAIQRFEALLAWWCANGGER